MIFPEINSLYKYATHDRAVKILEDDEVWYSKPSLFNDPFEGRYEVGGEVSPYSIIALAAKYKSGIGKSWGEISEYISKEVIKETGSGFLLKADAHSKMKDALERFSNEMREVGVLSLAQDPCSILMWSHYADQHKGVCIEFERNIDEDSGANERSAPVIYSDSYPAPRVDEILLDERSVTNKLIFTKSFHWAYEKEWRLWKQEGNQCYPLPGPVRSIILGQAWQGDGIKMKALAKKHSAKLLQAKISQGRYEIEIRSA